MIVKNKFFNTFQHCSEETLWKDVYQLPAAHYLEFDIKTKKFSITEYWKLKYRKINNKSAQEELEYLLKKSVKLCTQADVDYGLYYSKGVDSTLISSFHNFKNKFYFDYNTEKLNSLSKRELQVLKLFFRGKKNIEISEKLNINQKTVNTYITRVMKKLEVNSKTDLYLLAKRHIKQPY